MGAAGTGPERDRTDTVESAHQEVDAQDSELLVWPVVAGLLGLANGLALGTAGTSPGSIFLENVLLVQTVVLTVAVALVAIIAQRSNVEIRLLMRIGASGVRLIFAEFIAGITLSVLNVVVLLHNVSSIALPNRTVPVSVLVLLFVSTALLVVSLLILLRRTTPERLARGLISAAEAHIDRSEHFDRWMAEVEAYADRLVAEFDLSAFRQLVRGVAQLQRRSEGAQADVGLNAVPAHDWLPSKLESLQVRLLVRGQKQSLFGQAVVTELYRSSNAMRARLEEILLRVTSAQEMDRDLIVEVLRFGSHIGPNRDFWTIGLQTLLSPTRVAIWDNLFVRPFVEQVANQRISGSDLRLLVDAAIALPSATPDRLAMFVSGIDSEAEALRDSSPRVHQVLQKQVCRLRPRVLRGAVEAHMSGEVRRGLSTLIRESATVGAAIGAHFEVTASSVVRELKSLDGDAGAIFALIVLAGVPAQGFANEAREAVERQLSESLAGGDPRLVARGMQELFVQADSDSGVLGRSLALRTMGTRLDGVSAAVHVLWACKALGKDPDAIVPRSLDYIAAVTPTGGLSAPADEVSVRVIGGLVERSLASMSARLSEAERLTMRGRLTAFSVLAAALALAVRNHGASDTSAAQQRSVVQSLRTIAVSAESEVLQTNADLFRKAMVGARRVLKPYGITVDGGPNSLGETIRAVESLYGSASMES